MNLPRYREWLSGCSTKRVRDEVVNVRENLNAAQSERARKAWEKMLNIAVDVLKVKEAKDEARSRK